MRGVRPLRRVLNGEGAEVAAHVHIHERVFVQVTRLDDGLSVPTGVMSMPPFRKTEITDAELAALSQWIATGGGRR
jgi:mono/diheme cytochrome c family protein